MGEAVFPPCSLASGQTEVGAVVVMFLSKEVTLEQTLRWTGGRDCQVLGEGCSRLENGVVENPWDTLLGQGWAQNLLLIWERLE